MYVCIHVDILLGLYMCVHVGGRAITDGRCNDAGMWTIGVCEGGLGTHQIHQYFPACKRLSVLYHPLHLASNNIAFVD